jgi:hypothetical protein
LFGETEVPAHLASLQEAWMSSRTSQGMAVLLEPNQMAGAPTLERDMADLERALLRRGMDERSSRRTGCARCCRTPLVGERVYVAATGEMLCALCQSHEADPPAHSRLVRGPEFGHTLRLLDRHAA